MIKKCCACCIDGTWRYEDLIGAKVKISSLPVYNRLISLDGNLIYTIEDLIFQISETGKTICIVRLKNLDCDFTLKDLEIISLRSPKTICGDEVICGTVLVNG
jgi:hypothetical protein